MADICSPAQVASLAHNDEGERDKKTRTPMKDFQYITSQHPAFVENLYQDFVKDPASVDPEFRKFFEGFDFAVSSGVTPTNGNGAVKEAPQATTESGIDWKRELGAYRMILGYRNKGHLIAKTNPIRKRRDRGANLNLEFFGLLSVTMIR